MAARIIPLNRNRLPAAGERLTTAKTALAVESLHFFQVAVDEAAKYGSTPKAAAVLERALGLLVEARLQFELDHL